MTPQNIGAASGSSSRRDPDWSSIRASFPALRGGPDPLRYVDTASMGLPPECVVADSREALEVWAKGSASWRSWEADAERAREHFATLLGVASDRVALTNSLSAAASQVAASLPDPAKTGRGTLLVGAEEFRSNLFPWWSQERRGYRLRSVPFRGGGPMCEDLIAAIDSTTALVAVSHVQSATGHLVDLVRLAGACRERGALLFVDGTQSVGAVPTPMEGVDFLATHAYKWLLAPRGGAFLVVDPEQLDAQVPLQPNWRSPAAPHTDYYGGPYQPGGGASALDASLAWPVWPGVARALAFLLEVGPEAIHARNRRLADRFRGGLLELGLPPLAARDGCAPASPIVTLEAALPGGVEELRAALERERIVASVRSGFLRTSFHFYNDEEDVDRVLAALRGAGAGSAISSAGRTSPSTGAPPTAR